MVFSDDGLDWTPIIKEKCMAKVLTNREIKSALSDAIIYKDMLFTVKGKRNERDDLTAEQLKIFNGIVNKFTHTMEVGCLKKELIGAGKPIEEKDFIYVKAGELIEDGYAPLTERHTEDPISFDEKEIEFIRSCCASRTDLINFKEFKQLMEWLHDKVDTAKDETPNS